MGTYLRAGGVEREYGMQTMVSEYSKMSNGVLRRLINLCPKCEIPLQRNSSYQST